MTPNLHIGIRLWFIGCILALVGLLVRCVWNVNALMLVSGCVLLVGSVLMMIDGIASARRRITRRR